MAVNDSHRSSERFTRMSHFFGTPGKLHLLLLAALVLSPKLLLAQWNAEIGAQSSDLGRQALAFLPNEIWIHAGESITWTVEANEPHTVTFLTSDQIRPPFTVGCPGFSEGSATFDGTNCITSTLLFKGEKLTVVFPVAGNFKLVCLVHADMTGAIHVLDSSQPLPHDQTFYDRVAQSESKDLLRDEDASASKHHHSGNSVTVGHGEIAATGGGTDSLSVMRFTDPDMTVHAGDTIEWTNDDPSTAHTVTFGPEPQDLVDPSSNVTNDADGARHGVLNSPSDNVHSGFIQPAPQDRTGLTQAPSGVTRFRVTFTKPGIYPYICSLHDVLGMKGTVFVLP
jgi:plastocyanin